jgi:hypothetical protein
LIKRFGYLKKKTLLRIAENFGGQPQQCVMVRCW